MGAGDQPDRNLRTLLGHNRTKGFPKTDPDHSRFVEMQGIGSGDPLAGFIKHKDARMRFLVCRGDLATPGHIGLSDQ